MPMPPLMSTIHGITDEMVAGKPSIEMVLPEFERFIGDGILLAHNAPYDISILLMAMMRHWGGRAPGNLVLDTCTMARAAFPGAPNYKLSTVAQMLGITSGRPHRALSDAYACKGIFEKQLEHKGASATVADLVRLNGSELRLGLSEEMLAEIPRGPELAAILGDALRHGQSVRISYHGGTKGPGLRLVNPITLMRQNDGIYLVAHCTLDRSLKCFRLEKVSAILPSTD